MYQICQSRLNILTNKKKIIKNLPKDLESFAKVAKFRQIWSHCDADAKFTMKKREFFTGKTEADFAIK